VVTAWWTAEGSRPRVQVAFSTDSGSTFGPPIRADIERGDGHVAVGLLSDGARVAWLEGGRVYARLITPTGRVGPAILLGTASGRIRLPAMVPLGDGRLLMGWLEGKPSTLRLRSIGRSAAS
jgi:hypothetical protein